ncbi:MAG: CehA/McbA family metallohydrolase [Pirellulales bacterium]
MKKSSLALALLGMVLAANRSAPAQDRVCWGDMHGHTSLSDGKGSLDDYFTHARDVAKLDFVVVSDHDFGNATPWRMPVQRWKETQDKADQYTVEGKFVAVAGYEWTSQSKYWTPEEPLYRGPIKYYNHKNVYFPSHVDALFSAKDLAYNSPDLLAEAVLKRGGLVQNNHPAADLEGRDQFDYQPRYEPVIANTEMWPDTVNYQGKTYPVNGETTVRTFLNRGGKTGFVGSTDTHEGKPAAKTAVLARALTRPAIFEALRHRRNYAVTRARIVLDFQINSHGMGEEIEIDGKPRLAISVHGTDRIREVAVIRDGGVVRTISPNAKNVEFVDVDEAFGGNSYYYVRVIQVDTDEYGNPSCAWSSPIWVKKRP